MSTKSEAHGDAVHFAYFKETHPDGSWSLFREASHGTEEIFHRRDGWRPTTLLSERRSRGEVDESDRVTETEVAALLRPFEVLPSPRHTEASAPTASAAFAGDELRAIAERRAAADAERSDPGAFPESPAHPAVLVVGYTSAPQDEVVVRVREEGDEGDGKVRELTVPSEPRRPIQSK